MNKAKHAFRFELRSVKTMIGIANSDSLDSIRRKAKEFSFPVYIWDEREQKRLAVQS